MDSTVSGQCVYKISVGQHKHTTVSNVSIIFLLDNIYLLSPLALHSFHCFLFHPTPSFHRYPLLSSHPYPPPSTSTPSFHPTPPSTSTLSFHPTPIPLLPPLPPPSILPLLPPLPSPFIPPLSPSFHHYPLLPSYPSFHLYPLLPPLPSCCSKPFFAKGLLTDDRTMAAAVWRYA